MRFLLAIALCLMGFTQITFAKEPPNLSLAKAAVRDYYQSGEYHRDIQTNIQQAMTYLKQNLKNYKQQKPAIVLDIDETALSNYPIMKQLNFGMLIKEFRHYESQGIALVIKPTLDLFRFAKANKIAVFFISGRPEWQRNPTIKNLRRAGYAHWDGLFLKPKKILKVPDEVVKTNIRKKIIQQGYRIVLNVGDQPTDLVGGFADKTIKLPNPFYIPEFNKTNHDTGSRAKRCAGL